MENKMTRLATHSERCEARRQQNGVPYPDNPSGWAYNNFGDLVHPETKMPHKYMGKELGYVPLEDAERLEQSA